MTIWILALVLFGLFGSAGAQQGAIRMLISLVGVFMGAFFSIRLSGLVAPVVPFFGLGNPVWNWLLPPLIVFFAFVIAFAMFAQFVHHKVSVYYGFRAADEDRMKWERLNGKLGAPIGLAMGATYTVIVGLVIYVLGYVSVQFKSPDSTPAMVKFLNRARTDLDGNGLSKLAASFDRTPSTYYDSVDVLALLYNNPDLGTRLARYPGFLSFMEKPEILDIATDAGYAGMIRNQVNFLNILKHPKTRAVLDNKELLAALGRLDGKDLMQYLQTGKSPKYDIEKILGQWELDATGTVQAFAKKNPNVQVPDLNRLKAVIFARMSDLQVVADTESGFSLKGTQGDVAQFSQILADKRPVMPASLAANEAPLRVLAQGNWKGAGDKYQITVKMENGEKSGEATIDDAGRLNLNVGGQELVFVRVRE